jgi:hypothetical protein
MNTLNEHPRTSAGTKGQWFSDIKCLSESSGGLVIHKLLGSNPSVSDLVKSRVSPRVCISNKFPEDVVASLGIEKY